jgi:hypothetical protein
VVEEELFGRVRDLLDAFGVQEVLLACARYCEEEAACGGTPGLELLAREWERAEDLLRRAARDLAL